MFNLKQMAKTLYYLEENRITCLVELGEKVQEVNRECLEVSGRLKEIEIKMKENRELQKHIFNYFKTKEIYMGYRNSGYSKKFYEEHVEELLLHKAAQEVFDKMDVRRVPKVKELRDEYQKLGVERKKNYNNIRNIKKERKTGNKNC